MRRTILASVLTLVLVFSLAALPLTAQHPNVERGFDPGQSFQIGDVDHVNLFNGSLLLTLPIGQSYPVGGALSYKLALTYSSGVWDHRNGGDLPQPSLRSNAGLGWMVSLGRYYSWDHPENDRDLNLYVGPDGSEHWFYYTLHAGDADDPGDGTYQYQQSVWYSRDGSYLRSKKTAAGWDVEFPDGQIHSFDSSGRLTRMRDRFTNNVQVTYTTTATGNPLWQITDSHGRTQEVQFQSLPWNGGTAPMIEEIRLTAFGAATAKYTFSYQGETIPRECSRGIDLLPLSVNVQLLTAVGLPDGSSYQMPVTDYIRDSTSSAANCKASGVISAMRLPTLGRLEWTWQSYLFPAEASRPPFQRAAGVASRAVRHPSGQLLGVWNYQTSGNQDTKELVNTVTTPLGHRTVNYFSVATVNQLEPGWSSWDYSLPFTRNANDGAGRYLSTQVYAASGALLRSTYVRYERDQKWGASEVQDKTNGNRREASRRTVYHDDAGRVADVNHSNFDGLGHYRQTQTGGNFQAGDVRTTFTGYNSGAGTYQLDANGNPQAGFTMVAASSNWLLEIFWDRVVTENGTQEQDLTCFNGSTGIVKRRRFLTTPGQLKATDVLVVYEHDAAGNVSAETWYGADAGGVSVTDVCSVLPAVNQYRIVSTWSKGTLATSQYDGVSFKSADRTIDARTGRIAASRDTAGLETLYEYDTMGRQTWEIPGTGQGGVVEYAYNPAVSATDLADVIVRRRANGGKSAAVLSIRQALFDPLGRLWREMRRLPGGLYNVRETLYDGAGNKASESETQTGNPSEKTEFLSHDPFGRPQRIRPSDGAAHDITLSYAGVRSVTRTANVGTAYNATAGTVTESASATTELYDRQGRLWKVTEPSGAAGANVTTTYTYDVRDRLREVSTTATVAGSPVTQKRTFVYDNLGFLRSETHPEKGGVAGGGAMSYPEYDARGHFKKVIDGEVDLTYVYDRAERLTRVRQTTGALDLKVFTYDTCTGVNNWCNGKLVVSERYNRLRLGTSDLTVLISETYTHGGRDGRVSQRDTQAYVNGNAVESFTQRFDYYHLGNVQRAYYPECTHAACAPAVAAPRTVENTFSEGLLASVKVGTLVYGTVSYHPNLMVHQVSHANGVIETQALDPDGMRRPASLNAKLGAATLWSSGGYTYDGSGNVTKNGSSWYLYDKVSRLVSANLWDSATGGGTQRAQTYTFDPFGNITAVGGTNARSTPTSAATNRLNAAGVSYDTMGNLKTWNGAAYVYDAFDRMTRMTSGTEDWLYIYTADDERIWSYKVGVNASRWTLRDLDHNVLREYSNNNGTWSVAEDYLYRDGQLLAAETPAGRKHFHLDHLGTPRLITNAGGQSLAYHLYFPFGEEATPFNQDSERMKLTGHERDLGSPAGTGDDLDYMHARHYSPVTGRFLGFDVGGPEPKLPQSWNRYAYAWGNPVIAIDPDGREIKIVSPDPIFRAMVEAGLDQLERTSPRLKEMVQGLRDSKNVHVIREVATSIPTNQAKSQDDAENEKGTGSFTDIALDPIDDKGEAMGFEEALAHELSHAEDADTGTRDTEVKCAGCAPQMEVKAVQMQNQVRKEPRTTYGDQRVPDATATPANPRKKKAQTQRRQQ